MTREELLALQAIPIMELRREELSDAEEIEIDLSKSVNQRVESFLEQARNPFALNVGEYILQIGYMEETEETFNDRMVMFARKQTDIL